MNNSSETTHNNLDVEETNKRNYYLNIRNKILARKKEFEDCGYSINVAALSEYIRTNYNIPINDRTIQKLFRYGCSDEISPHYLIPVCNALGINIYDLLQYQGHIEAGMQNAIKSKRIFRPNKSGNVQPLFNDITDNVENISFLTNDLYEGDFYCYYFYPNKLTNSISKGQTQPQASRIRFSTLKIERINGETVATFREENPLSGKSFTFRGRVMRLEQVDKIYIFLSEPNGNGFMWLLFNHVVLKKRNLYYKEIGMLTHSISSQSEPIFEKMILTQKPLDTKDDTITETLRGILTFNEERILIPEENVTKIFANPEYEVLRPIFDFKKTYYEISKYDILNNNRLNDWDYNKRAEVLLYILSLSDNPVQSTVSQEENIHNYFFTLQGLDKDNTPKQS